MVAEVLHQMHTAVFAGHLGLKKTREKVLQRFYWYGLHEDIDVYVRACDNCARNKGPAKYPRAPLGNMQTGAPMDRLCTDLIGPLPVTPRKNRFILLVTDHFSKWREVFPVPDQTATTCAKKILDEVITRFGCPLNIHSDRGRNYESEIF